MAWDGGSVGGIAYFERRVRKVRGHEHMVPTQTVKTMYVCICHYHQCLL